MTRILNYESIVEKLHNFSILLNNILIPKN